MDSTTVTLQEAQSYERGVHLAKNWIGAGGDLNADGPDTKDEAFYNGFIDTIAAERRSREAHQALVIGQPPHIYAGDQLERVS